MSSNLANLEGGQISNYGDKQILSFFFFFFLEKKNDKGMKLKKE
jgi:hypothetical protein